jgi:hypothetical protein
LSAAPPQLGAVLIELQRRAIADPQHREAILSAGVDVGVAFVKLELLARPAKAP